MTLTMFQGKFRESILVCLEAYINMKMSGSPNKEPINKQGKPKQYLDTKESNSRKAMTVWW